MNSDSGCLKLCFFFFFGALRVSEWKPKRRIKQTNKQMKEENKWILFYKNTKTNKRKDHKKKFDKIKTHEEEKGIKLPK